VYVAGVNGALSKHPEFEKLDIVAVLKQAADMPADIKTAVRNHGAAQTYVFFMSWHGPAEILQTGLYFPSERCPFARWRTLIDLHSQAGLKDSA